MTAIGDLAGIEVEHLLGERYGPLVKIRCLSTGGAPVILLGQVDPAAAREIAGHLLEAAARAEYEADLFHTMRAEGWTVQESLMWANAAVAIHDPAASPGKSGDDD